MPERNRKKIDFVSIFSIDTKLGVKEITIIAPTMTAEQRIRYAAVGSTDESPIFSKKGANPAIKAASKANKK